jgi:outer membrane lipoprotein-sorting protein
MKRFIALALIAFLSQCTQSSQVFAPVNNVASAGTATPLTYTLTLNVASSRTEHQNQSFSALLFRNGTLFAAQYDDPAVTTDGSGAATIVLDGVNSATGCPTVGAPAALEAGTYTLYFAIRYAGETATWAKPTGCGVNGWINSSSGGNLYGTTASVQINGNTTFTVNGTNLALFKQHTFELQAGPGTYSCAVTDISVTTSSPTMQPLAVYSRNNAGTTTGDGTVTFLLPSGTYRYFCSKGVSTATGVLTVTGQTTTYLSSYDFVP